MRMLIKYSKANCVQCEEATEFCRRHNISVEEKEVKSSYEVSRRHPGQEDAIMRVRTWPMFYARDTDEWMDIEGMMRAYGEPMLLGNENRHVMFPIEHEEIWQMYEKAVASFWTTYEIDFTHDEEDFNKLREEEQGFIKNILAFFASADGIVNENLSMRFSHEVQWTEARAFYSYQQFNETIHSHTYSVMIDTLIKSSEERARLLQGIQHIPCVERKAKWASRWISEKESFAKRLIAFICVEGIMFSGSFCAIFWLKKRGLMHGLAFSNELISRDEGLHQQFGTLLYTQLRNPLKRDEVVEIVGAAVDHEVEFITESIPCRLIGMNSDLMTQYIHYVADRILLELGYTKEYYQNNPFDFMENISLNGKTNFFERRVGEYARAGVTQASKGNEEFALDAMF